ncbi:MAG: UDP-N-acetylglucosamine 2-epimerase [Planctomycetota bacterium]|nr:UDP-N-acetylglucosamine 2-epimerase [Planctomycetota bacterium]
MNQPLEHSRTIAIVSSSRADLAHLIHPLRALKQSERLRPVVLATGALLQDAFGSSVRRLLEETVPVEEVPCALEIEQGVDAARAIGRATIAFADALERMRPDLVMVVADRFEMLAPANAALAMKIPIVHVEGGERSEGAIDDAVRNALTKMAHVHLVTTEAARLRVLAMGEEAWRVHRVGAGSLDHFQRSTLPDRSSLETELGFQLTDPLVVAAIHPVTLEDDPTRDAFALLSALERRNPAKGTILFAFPNADEGSRVVREAVEAFVARTPGAFLRTNLPPESWIALLHCARLTVGNSSSILMETPSVPVPAICIGRRQEGRERARNVLDCEADPDSILRAMERGFEMSLDVVENPYGDGRASERIRGVLEALPDRNRLLHKTTTLGT